MRLVASGAQDSLSGLDDNARFRSVVMPHIDEAYRLAHWLTGNRTDAEDVVQDASLRAFRAIREFAGGSARSWVLSIVRNTAYSWLRKNRPAAVVTVEDLEAVELEHGQPWRPRTARLRRQRSSQRSTPNSSARLSLHCPRHSGDARAAGHRGP